MNTIGSGVSIEAKGLCRLLLVLVCIALGACQQTRFEAMPSGSYRDCDQQWVGAWRAETRDESDDSDDGPVYWIVDENCARYSTMESDGEEEKEDEYTLRYLTQDDAHFLIVAKAGLPSDADAADKAVMLFRYEPAGSDAIRVFDIDNRYLAQLILDGKVVGRSEIKNDSAGADPANNIENLIAGPSSATDAVLKRKGVFKRKPWLILHRAGAAETDKLRAKFLDQRNPESG